MIINKLLTTRNYDKLNNPNRVKYIVIHYVGALSDAKANCQYFQNTYRGASASYFVGYKGDIWQCVEDCNVAWHCGVSGNITDANCNNQNSIGIELCVRKKNTKTMYASDKDWYFEDATVDAAVELTKSLMEKYNVPAERVIRHYDVTGKICPNPYVYNTGNHTWAEFKSRIAKTNTAPSPASVQRELYRVRKTWADAASQVGAYTSLDNAKAACDKAGDEYEVYDSQGNVVYTKPTKQESNTRPTLKRGSTGAYVTELQKLLTKYGFYNSAIDGSFGSLTYSAVVAFQREVNTIVDGVVGNITWNLLLNYKFTEYRVSITANVLNIRKGAGVGYSVVGQIKDKGVYTIVDERDGWGLLKSYSAKRNGWISLSYTKKI